MTRRGALAVLGLSGLAGCRRKPRLGVLYREVGGEKLRVDIFYPPRQSVPGPAILLLHGGGWSSGSREDFRDLATGLAQNGFVCFCASYRLTEVDRNRFPAQLDDVRACLRWIRENSLSHEVDSSRIGAIGASAGGQLAVFLGLGKDRVRCVVDLFGPTDLTVPFGVASNLDMPALLTRLIGKRLDRAPDLYRAASPLYLVTADAAPFLIFHGADDLVIPPDQSRRLDAALKANGVESTLIVFPGEAHGFLKKENLDTFGVRTMSFFNTHLK